MSYFCKIIYIVRNKTNEFVVYYNGLIFGFKYKTMLEYAYNEQLEEDVLVEEEVADTSAGEPANLIVFNDDDNTFDWVITSFMDVLGHSEMQAEQLALLIHFKGKATVKSAPMKVLRPHKDALIDRKLSAVIEGGK